MNDQGNVSPNRRIIVNTLAVAGFIALIGASMWLAVYSTRFVPGVVSRIGAAAVYLGSVFVPAPDDSLSVIPAASTTPSGNSATTTSATSTPVKPAPPKTTVRTPGEQTTNTVQIDGSAATAFSGLPDLVVRINAVGYLATSSATSFVASSTVPAGSRPAVNFTIMNIGTNVAGAWRFSATIPRQTAFIFQSEPQLSLAPGDRIDYTLGFDQANRGTDQMISITANYDRAVGESNANNNSASARLTILGS